MALTNPFLYTSKSFEALLNDVNNDNELVDKPNWWKRAICGIGDIVAMWNNALANNLLLRTAYTRRNVQLLLELIDYQMTPHTTANGIALFYIKGSASFPFTVQKEDLVALTTGSVSVSSKRYEGRSNVAVSAVSENFTSTEVNTSTDVITVTRDFLTGEKVRFTATGTLPAPLAVSTDYYVIRVSATEIKLATSLVNAYSSNSIDITTGGSGTHTIHLYSFQATLYQQQTKDEFSIGISDGITEFQEFDLADKNILEDTLVVTINSFSWSKVDTLIYSGTTDKHFRLFYNTDNTSRIQFGNGIYGAIPPAFDIEVTYAYGGGVDSNVTVVNRVSTYGGTDTNIEAVSNPILLTGGADTESIETAKILGPLLLKARDRFVTSEDGEALCLAYGGLTLAKIIKNEYGPLSAKVITIAAGGGNPSGAVKTALETYLIDRTILESIDVRVEDTTITAQNVTSAAKLLSGYTWSGGVEDYFRLAWKLFFSETSQEIKDDYDSNGIESAIDLINIYFSESFGESDYTAVRQLLDNLEPRQIADSIQVDDAIAYIRSSVDGIDYMTITAPTFPISLATDEITTDGSLTLTEIP
jgi:hypothetical protein